MAQRTKPVIQYNNGAYEISEVELRLVCGIRLDQAMFMQQEGKRFASSVTLRNISERGREVSANSMEGLLNLNAYTGVRLQLRASDVPTVMAYYSALTTEKSFPDFKRLGPNDFILDEELLSHG